MKIDEISADCFNSSSNEEKRGRKIVWRNFCEKLILSRLLLRSRRGAKYSPFKIADTFREFLPLIVFFIDGIYFFSIIFSGNFKEKSENLKSQKFIVRLPINCLQFLNTLKSLACCLDMDYLNYNCMINGKFSCRTLWERFQFGFRLFFFKESNFDFIKLSQWLFEVLKVSLSWSGWSRSSKNKN